MNLSGDRRTHPPSFPLRCPLRAGFYDKAKAMTLVAATKVTWFLTNHHAGQNAAAIEHYSGKVVGAMGLRPDDRDLRKILWVGGKWTSTKSVLKGLNISDTPDDMSVGVIDTVLPRLTGHQCPVHLRPD
jgi:hypothetical protein